MKGVSIRIPDQMAAELEAIARTEEVPISEAIRSAISRDIAARRVDERFQARLREQMEKEREVLERLAN